jgi:putative DNA modification/repair radical SAM protein
MNTKEKLAILSDAAKYDASCSSSGSSRKNSGGTGDTASSGICHSWTPDGRCISLLKILFTNRCVYDCAYCVSRCSNELPRAAFTPREVVDLTMNFYRRNYIEGLFLSSAVEKSPDYTMEQLVAVVELLRTEQHFGGYIHLKTIPGANDELVRRAGLCCDRISVNIELPSEDSLKKLAPQKSKSDILTPMKNIGRRITESRAERKKHKKAPLFAPAGQSTQLIIGATPEDDRKILTLSDNLYSHFNLKRVYYSSYIPVNPAVTGTRPHLLREHRLYQADWLMRLYGFACDEILPADAPFLDEQLDPKTAWALRNPERFPVDINRAAYEELLRVPGIGFRSAQRMVTSRGIAALRREDLSKFGVVMKRAQFFITCAGRDPLDALRMPHASVRQILMASNVRKRPSPNQLVLNLL